MNSVKGHKVPKGVKGSKGPKGTKRHHFLCPFCHLSPLCPLIFAFILPLAELSAESDEDIKKSISAYEAEANSAASEQKGRILFKLALAHLHDQDQEKAFKDFLLALESTKPLPAPKVSELENGLYEKGLTIYLAHDGAASPKETALKIYQACRQAAESHPDFFLLNLLMGTAYANLGRFEEFFNAFYLSYPYYADHYLAYKTKAVLHIRLFERERALDEREVHKKKVFYNIEKAIEKNPKDIGLYKIAFLFADENKKPEVIAAHLNNILDHNILVPRSEVPFFAFEAVETGKLDLAQKFVDKSREWYQYSRAVNEAQELIDKRLMQNPKAKKSE